MQKAIISHILDVKWLAAVSIVVGTSIGAGMLGLPVETARAGFLPTLGSFLITWLMTITTGILFSDVILSQKEKANYISLGKNILGPRFVPLIFGLYILLFYSLIAAYTKGIGTLLSDNLAMADQAWKGSFLFIAIFLPLMYFGTHAIGRANGFLTCALLVLFVLLISAGNKGLSFERLSHQNWGHSLFSLPLVISSFGFHGTLPSIVDYLERDRKKINLAIVVGCTITLAIYLIWELFILGSVPLNGEVSLLSAWENDQTAISPLSQLSGNPAVWRLAHLFSLTAIVTSFFGVSIGLIDFLLDAFQLKKTRLSITALLFLVYISALFLSMTDLRIFYLSLNYGAGVAGIFLLIFLPAFMAKRRQIENGQAIPLVFLFSAVSLLGCILSFFG